MYFVLNKLTQFRGVKAPKTNSIIIYITKIVTFWILSTTWKVVNLFNTETNILVQ